MKITKLLLTLSLSQLLLPGRADSGAGTIAVIDGEGKLCAEQGPEVMVVRLTSEEAIAALANWLHDRPQDLILTERHINVPGWKKEELRSFLNIAFSGYIKFCGDRERKRFFAALIDEMMTPQSNERVFVQMLLHSRSKSLLEAIEARLATIPGNSAAPKETRDETNHIFQANLEKAKRLIVYQKKSPEPYPTENVVRRIEKRINGG